MLIVHNPAIVAEGPSVETKRYFGDAYANCGSRGGRRSLAKHPNDLIQERVVWCESERVSILCCPEAILGGLADYSENPARFTIRTDGGRLPKVLAPLASDTVTSIVGFAYAALFVPTNNGLPNKPACTELVQEARAADIARAVENRVWVIPADVARENAELMSYGSSGIVDPDGKVVQRASLRNTDFLVADIEATPQSGFSTSVVCDRSLKAAYC
jgi:hypothetical protein